MTILVIFGNVLLALIGQVLLKLGANALGPVTLQNSGRFLTRALASPLILLGLLLYFISALFWIGVLSRVDLSVAYPILATGFIFAVFSGAFFFNEPVTLLRWLGVLLIVAGIGVVALTHRGL